MRIFHTRPIYIGIAFMLLVLLLAGGAYLIREKTEWLTEHHLRTDTSIPTDRPALSSTTSSAASTSEDASSPAGELEANAPKADGAPSVPLRLPHLTPPATVGHNADGEASPAKRTAPAIGRWTNAKYPFSVELPGSPFYIESRESRLGFTIFDITLVQEVFVDFDPAHEHLLDIPHGFDFVGASLSIVDNAGAWETIEEYMDYVCGLEKRCSDTDIPVSILEEFTIGGRRAVLYSYPYTYSGGGGSLEGWRIIINSGNYVLDILSAPDYSENVRQLVNSLRFTE